MLRVVLAVDYKLDKPDYHAAHLNFWLDERIGEDNRPIRFD